MTTKKISRKSKCSPAIWKKFSRAEKTLWNDLYAMYLFPGYYHTDWTKKEFQKQREVVAHNLACETVCYLAEYFDHWINVIKTLQKKSQKKNNPSGYTSLRWLVANPDRKTPFK